MRRVDAQRWFWMVLSGGVLLCLLLASWMAPENIQALHNHSLANLGPLEAPPLGTDDRGIGLHYCAMQGAKIVLVPALTAGGLVMFLAVVSGVLRCSMGGGRLDNAIQIASEMLGALPRMVVILVVATLLPKEWASLMPIAVTWAVLAAPGVMDEAATAAGRLGGERFVEALRAHGFSAVRTYLYHVVWLNLRSVIVRQGVEVMMQVVYLEIALSYMIEAADWPPITHSSSTESWAYLLYIGFEALVDAFVLDPSMLLVAPLYHALYASVLVLGLMGLMGYGFMRAARAR
jgi:ABC-type dipeptide/oligopeptide/nickel transport system permease subunit